MLAYPKETRIKSLVLERTRQSSQLSAATIQICGRWFWKVQCAFTWLSTGEGIRHASPFGAEISKDD